MLYWTEIRWRIFHFFGFRNSLVAFAARFGSLSICEADQFPASDWIWAESVALCTPEFIPLLLSAVTSLINTSDACSHTCPCHRVWQIMWCASDHEVRLFLSMVFCCLSCWYKLILVSSAQRIFGGAVQALVDVFWQSLIWLSSSGFHWFALCSKFSAFRFVKASLDCRSWSF